MSAYSVGMNCNPLISVMLSSLVIYTLPSHRPTEGRELIQSQPSLQEVKLRLGAQFSDPTTHGLSGASCSFKSNVLGMQKEGGGFQGLINMQENIKAQTVLRLPEGEIEA